MKNRFVTFAAILACAGATASSASDAPMPSYAELQNVFDKSGLPVNLTTLTGSWLNTLQITNPTFSAAFLKSNIYSYFWDQSDPNGVNRDTDNSVTGFQLQNSKESWTGKTELTLTFLHVFSDMISILDADGPIALQANSNSFSFGVSKPSNYSTTDECRIILPEATKILCRSTFHMGADGEKSYPMLIPSEEQPIYFDGYTKMDNHIRAASNYLAVRDSYAQSLLSAMATAGFYEFVYADNMFTSRLAYDLTCSSNSGEYICQAADGWAKEARRTVRGGAAYNLIQDLEQFYGYKPDSDGVLRIRYVSCEHKNDFHNRWIDQSESWECIAQAPTAIVR